MLYRIAFLCCFLLLPLALLGQNWALGLELGGTAGLAGLGLEYQLIEDKQGVWLAWTTLGTQSFLDFRGRVNPDANLAFGLARHWGKKHKVDCSLGLLASSVLEAGGQGQPLRRQFLSLAPSLSYVYSMPNKPFQFRLGYAPLLISFGHWAHWARAGFAYRF